MAAKLERDFQPIVIKKLKETFPDCMILKNDPTYIQGIPDLSVFFKNKWAMLEVKKSKDEPFRPNQDFYLMYAESMSFARVIFPENMEQVLSDLKKFFDGGDVG